MTQILLALASSPLPWTGAAALRLIGYSMGGGIAVHFAATFPHVVSSLVLLAPAGLIREENFGVASRLLFRSGIVPDKLLAGLTRRRLRRPIESSVTKKKGPTPTLREQTPAGSTLDGSADSMGETAHMIRSSLHDLTDRESMTDFAATEAGPSESATALEQRVLDY
ncbi:alpha/beta fold hydrolase, partial [Candidatus Bathyarchaeota archaeon]|nr:alpha/beta fold hydrolase [Candidatus Bathyarchaeota archaeon]